MQSALFKMVSGVVLVGLGSFVVEPVRQRRNYRFNVSWSRMEK